MSFLTGFALGDIHARYQRDLRRTGRALAGIQSDNVLAAEIQALRNHVAALEVYAHECRDNALAWKEYAERLQRERASGG